MFKLLVCCLLASAIANPVEDVYPEEGEFFEGDIELPPGMTPEDISVDSHNVIIGQRYRWTDNTIPYEIGFEYSPTQVEQIRAGVRDLNEMTRVNGRQCINIREATDDDINYVSVEMGSGCSSFVGMIGGSQRLSLAPGCFRHGTIMHEFMHALGIYHEQSRGDRDDWVEIVWDNIRPGTERNFRRLIDGVSIDHLNTPYDYDSCMHYGAFAFAVDRSIPTILQLQEGPTIGQRTHLSTQDIIRIQKAYGCIPTDD